MILTGENLNDAQPGFDSQTQEPTVNLELDNRGARIFQEVTRENVGRRMAILLFEKGKGEVVTAPVIRQEIGGGRVQISGQMTTMEATDTALVLRAGSLAAPMEIVEERLIGPSLGEANIEAGFRSTLYGFIVIAVFMAVYYQVFGVVSAISLICNVMMLIAILSMLQATLTLPGIAAIALTLGMAVDSNVLINERVREELRIGRQPQTAISEGYERAFATILDSNVTSLIAGLALLIFGSGPVRGFAVVLGHWDFDFHFRHRFPRPDQLDLRPPEEAYERPYRPNLASGPREGSGEVSEERQENGILPHSSNHSVHALSPCAERDFVRQLHRRCVLDLHARFGAFN